MKRTDFESISIDELWGLHEEIATTLAAKLASEKSRLEDRLRQLNQQRPTEHKARAGIMPLNGAPARRPYPTVVPKYRNPDEPSETWSGRGKQPRWLVAQLSTGKQIGDFRIDNKTERSRSTALGSRDTA